jgi:Holliday junction resolvasome RuvABC endonuclease subunit
MLGYTIAIDPGSNLGVSIFGIDVSTLEILSIEAFTMKRNGFIAAGNNEIEYHGERHVRLATQRARLTDLYERYNPLIISSESPYFNSRMPTAFESLIQCMAMIRQSIYDYDPLYVLYPIDPSSIKKTVGANGVAKKDGVKAAVMNLPIIRLLGVDVINMDEHSIDAIAVNYTVIERMKLNNRRFIDVAK